MLSVFRKTADFTIQQGWLDESTLLDRNGSTVSAIYFAEFESTIPRAEKFYVKKGEAFVFPGVPEKWTLREVKEDSCTIFRKGEDGKEIVKTLTKTK
ncbi:hypothetical protein OAE61_03655 [Verrucomicrobiales bacterium]|nr:hypothetical protein [bacterium]MDB4657410.1 hypothetical protein [Verrucomicrobiales bacterium]MDB4662708.1 hypothetical protein [Verrucomicrobiales bacterium]MDC0311989.1 hypothetical protein [bacterium]